MANELLQENAAQLLPKSEAQYGTLADGFGSQIIDPRDISEVPFQTLRVYGASDDLVEIEGSIRAEFDYTGDNGLLAFSDGTVLRIQYTNPGVWRITPVVRGTASVSIDLCSEELSNGYTDVAIIKGHVDWVVFASHIQTARSNGPKEQSSNKAKGFNDAQ